MAKILRKLQGSISKIMHLCWPGIDMVSLLHLKSWVLNKSGNILINNCLAVRSLQSIGGLGTTVLMCVFNVCITCFVIAVIYFSLFV